MTEKIWQKGLKASDFESQFYALVDGVNVNPLSTQTQDTFEEYKYEDTLLTANQKADLNSFFNSNQWTNIQ